MISTMGRFVRRSCSKLGPGWWRVIAEFTNGSLPIADVFAKKRAGGGREIKLILPEPGVDPRTGKGWKSAKAILEFLHVRVYIDRTSGKLKARKP